ncbi:hypothetical protein MAP00_007963 [Monascus purpureus]|nr:hypothetical protein MAP00_007963 [Monascus purpureus]
MDLLPTESETNIQAIISGANAELLDSLSAALRTDVVLKAIANAITNALVLDLTAGCIAVLVAVFLRRTKMSQTHGAVGGM